MLSYLRSLVALNGTGRGRARVSIEGRLFKVPAFTPEQKKVIFLPAAEQVYKSLFSSFIIIIHPSPLTLTLNPCPPKG